MANELTPGRGVSVVFDPPETILIEEGWGYARRQGEMAPGEQGITASGLKYWASGCFTLLPTQSDISQLRETTTGQNLNIGSHFTLIEQLVVISEIAILASVNTHKQDGSIPFVSYASGGSASGDGFMQKRIPASATGLVPITGTLDQPPVPANCPMDRTAETTTVFPADQALCIRWSLPGGLHDHPDGVLTVYFGTYSLFVDGTGRAHLWENPTLTSGAANWKLRDAWRYCLPSQVVNVEHTLMIYPHIGRAGERYIAFSNNALDISARGGGLANPDTHNVSAGEHIYRVGPTAYRGVADPCPGNVVAAGVLRYDTRRDYRPKVQFSKLGFATTGILQDYPGGFPPQSSAQPITLSLDARIPSTCTLVGAMHDIDNPTTGGNYGAFNAGTTNKPFAQMNFGGDGLSTPVLWGYTVSRPQVVNTITPGAFTVTGTSLENVLTSLSIRNNSADAQQESGSVTVRDVAGTLARLQTRGMLGVRVRTLFTPPGGGAQVSVGLLSGYGVRPTATKRGRLYSGGRSAASPDWRDYDIPLVGMWARLASRVQDTSFQFFWLDPTAPPDAIASTVPYKVTDAIRQLIRCCGFSDDYINIAPSPLRLWPGHDGKSDLNTVYPKATIAETIQKMARLYLGGNLIFDPNLGSDGQWTILYSPQLAGDGTFDSIFDFVTAPPGYGTTFQPAPHDPSYYPAGTAPILNSFTFQNEPPEYSLVFVCTGVQLDTNNSRLRICNWAFNPKGYSVPTFTTTLDPAHPDYHPLGAVPCVVIDASLYGAGANPQDVQHNVDWTVRRVYDMVCHGRRVARVRAPLCIIADPVTGRYRPLRALDPVSINGDPRYIIQSVDMDIRRGNFQFATYEVLAPSAGQFVRGAGSLDFYRRAHDGRSQRSTGTATQSHQHALKSVTPSAEQDIMALPDYGVYRNPLQNSDGSFKFLAGYDPS